MSKQFNTVFLILVHIYLSTANCGFQHVKCSLEDSACIRTQASAFLPVLAEGIPELGIEKLDTMFIDYVEMAAENNFKYEHFNSEIVGIKNATIDSMSINMRFKYIVILFRLPLNVSCDYKANGNFFGIPVFGSGKATVVRRQSRINMILYFNVTKDEKGRSFMDIESYRFEYDSGDGVVYDYKNVYDGDKEKQKRLLEFLNTNWLLISNYGRNFFSTIIDKIVGAVKIYMKHKPLEDLALM